MRRKTELKTETVGARIPTELRVKLNKVAKKRNERPSDVIRKAIVFYLAQN